MTIQESLTPNLTTGGSGLIWYLSKVTLNGNEYKKSLKYMDL